MKTTKPERIITIVHTGIGDDGNTQMGIHRVPKTHAKVKYIGLLDTCQSYTYFSDELLNHSNLNYNNLITKIQNVLFLLGGLTHSPNKKEYNDKVYKYYNSLKNTLKTMLNDNELNPLEGFIRTNKYNYSLMQLRCKLREAEIAAVYLIKTLKFDMDEIHIKMLNLLSDIVFTLVWIISVKSNSLSVWTEE